MNGPQKTSASVTHEGDSQTCQLHLRCLSLHHAGRSLSNDYFALETLHAALESRCSPNCPGPPNFSASPSIISSLQTVSSPLSHSTHNLSTFRICPPLTVAVCTSPFLHVPCDVCFGSGLPEKPSIPTFLWKLCEGSFYIALNQMK